MTVRELITQLERHPDDMDIVGPIEGDIHTDIEVERIKAIPSYDKYLEDWEVFSGKRVEVIMVRGV